MIGPDSAQILPDLITPISHSSAGVLNNSLFMTGGKKEIGITSKTEYISETKHSNGVALPDNLYGHCVIQVTPNEIMLTGGKDQ